MILRSVRLQHFRNFEDREFNFESWRNIIIWNNWAWKTNILEALALPQSFLVEKNPLYHLRKWSSNSGIHFEFDTTKLLYTYWKAENKKRFFSEKKSISKKKFQSLYPHIISFHPHMMDLLYGSPLSRRNFLDEILCHTFPQYWNLLQKYRKILTSRNRILTRIFEWKSNSSELQFWDKLYIELTLELYKYRDLLTSFFEANAHELWQYFFWKVNVVRFTYVSKAPHTYRWEYLSKYITENHSKEVYQRKTLRGPHLDDFCILIDEIPIEHFASRWEVKSVLLGLKFLWWDFIEKYSEKKDIVFLIDDIFSELDSVHMNMIYTYIWSRQCIITSIRDLDVKKVNKIYL